MITKRFGKRDVIFLSVLLTFIALACILFYTFGQKEGAQILVTIDGEFYGSYDLKMEQTVPIFIKERTANMLEIKNGSANMIQADCPDRLCVHQKAIAKSGESIICLPNKVVAGIVDAGASEFDSFAK